MSNKILANLLSDGPVVTDGAWGTELQRLGLGAGEFPESWNLLNPQQVFEVARSYVVAGSRVILTNTFGGNTLRLRETGLDHREGEINRAGVLISRQAAGGKAAVFASIGPSGGMLVSGDVTPGELRTAYRRQVDALFDAGPDGFVVETMADLEEAQIAIEAARRTGLPVVACVVFDSGRHKDRTMMGATPEEAAAALTRAGATAIGANCGQGIVTALQICQRLRKATPLPIWMKPNAGLPELREGAARYAMTPDEFAAQTARLIQLGADFVGGCCGTNPEFISAICRTVRSHQEITHASEAPQL